MDVRRSLFQVLKPPCVHLSEVAVKVSTTSSTANELIPALESLHRALLQVYRNNRYDLDFKLTDYAFYPLSLIFREREKVPFRVLELTLACLKLLLQTGWRRIDTENLAVQLLILLTFLADVKPLGKRKDVAPEEMRTNALDCISEIFSAIRGSTEVHDSLLQTQHIPALSHTVTVLIESAKDTSSSSKLQLAVLSALASFITAIPDRDVLASFFPGIVSALAQLLTPSTKARRVYKVYVEALEVLSSTIMLVLSDAQVFIDQSDQSISTQEAITTQGTPWLKATEGQLKVALSNVVRIRSHDRAEVQTALRKLCWLILVDCRKNLANCGPMMLETFITLSSSDSTKSNLHSLDALLVQNPSIAEELRSCLYDWLLALPRLVQSNDEAARQRIIEQIKTTYSVLINIDIDLSIINNMLLSTMSDSLVNAIGVADTSLDVVSSTTGSPEMGLVRLDTSRSNPDSATFNQILARQKKSMDILTDLKGLIATLSLSKSSFDIARDALDRARVTQDGSNIADLYLALTIVRNRASEEADFADIIDLTATSAEYDTIHDELYAYARHILTEPEDSPQDWRLQALALEAVAVEAQRQKSNFRDELTDALYPIVHLLGSPNQALREHAITCLNLVASACGYQSAQELVVSNVDYLVNAISARLNAFDISPQAVHALLMMVRLCGQNLLPYLDDLVDSIFEALECFHGYQSLVELLFSCLKVIVEEGVHAPQLLIEDSKMVSHRKTRVEPSTISSMVETIAKRRAKASQPLEAELGNYGNALPKETPHRPWAELRNKSDASGDDDPSLKDEDILEDDPPSPPTKDDPPPLTPQYKLLTRITTLTQHHLPNSSSSLRHNLLSLLHTSMPFLSAHEDTFLPLVHTLWRVLIPRLEDNEVFVLVGVLDVLGVIAEGAGDFVSARVEGLWERLKVLWKNLERESNDARSTAQISSKRTIQAQNSKAISSSTISQNDLLIKSPSSVSMPNSPPANITRQSTALTTLSTRTLSPSSTSTSQTPPTTNTTSTSTYTSTTTVALRAALTRFLVKLITHVRISQAMFEDVLYEMLWRDLLAEVREGSEADGGCDRGRATKEVREALKGVNADAVWLALFRAGIVKEAKEGMKMPGVVEGGVEWVVV